MNAQRRVEIVTDARFRDHRGPERHPERPERLEAIDAALAAREGAFVRRAPRPAQPEEILAIHRREHLDLIEQAARAGADRLDPDTYCSPASHEVALLAAGASVDLAVRVATREIDCGFAAVRPPGHHAESDRAMGFCLLNNAAIAARAVQQQAGVEKVLLLDWDVHHGNGTQHSFETDPSVLYVSTHQFPYYPGTGSAGEVGVGRGEGRTLNLPLPAGCGDAEYLGLFQHVLEPAARAFAPDYWIVSCGFDAHEDDPLAAMRVTQSGFAALTAWVRGLADELCGGRLLFVLEGGYSLLGLREGMDAVLSGILASAPTLPGAVPTPAESLLARLVQQSRDVHGGDLLAG